MPSAAPFDYSGERAREVSFPLGGIGTGSIGLSGAGRLIDWEILNRPDKGITNGISHFAVRAEQDGKVLDARILNGPYLGNRTGDFPADTSRNFGFGARRDSLVGMPHFAAQHLRGPLSRRAAALRATGAFPGTVELVAFNPFIPLNDRDFEHPGRDVRDRLHQPDRRRDRLHRRRRPRPRPASADQGGPRRPARA